MADYGELGYLLAQRRAAMPNRGAEELGAVLGGGGARSSMIFNRAASEVALMQDRLAQARQRQYDEIEKQRQRDARHRLGESQRQQGNAQLGDFFDAYDNPEQIAAANEKLLQAGAIKQALELANAPNVDYNHLNAIKIATAANPTELVRSLGDGSYTTNAYRTDPNVQLSDIGRAFVGEKRALAGEHEAQAARARAGIGADKAANYEVKETADGGLMLVDKLHPGNAQPVTSGGKPVMGQTKAPRSFTGEELGALFGDPNAPGKPDPEKLSRFLQEPGASDVDRLKAFQADNQAAAETGPPSNLAVPAPSMLARLFGAGDGTSNAPVSTGLPVATGAPKVGEVRKGYRFKGGDPSKQENWEKAA